MDAACLLRSKGSEPFFTQRRNGGGTGLGLSIYVGSSCSMVDPFKRSGGEGAGSTLELSLPNTNQADLKERLEKNKQGLENEHVHGVRKINGE